MEIIKQIKDGNKDEIEKNMTDDQKKRYQLIEEENRQKILMSQNQEKIKLFKINQEIERINELEQTKLSEDEIERRISTDYASLVDDVIKFCNKQPLPILHEVDDVFKEYLPCLPGTFTIIGGCSNAGKTTFVTKIVLDVMNYFIKSGKNKKILYLSPETPKEQVATILLSRLVGFDVGKTIRDGGIQKEKLIDALNSLQNKIEIVDVTKIDITHIDNFKLTVEKCIATDKYGFVMLDYIQCVSQSNDPMDGIGTKSIGRTAKLMNHWAMNHPSISFVAFAQLTKGKKDGSEGFKERIEKSKQNTYNVCDHALEILKGKNYESSFIVRKSRLPTTPVGARIKLGFDIERFCYCKIDDPVFLEKRVKWQEKFTDVVDDYTEDNEKEKISANDLANSILGDI